MTLAVPVFPAVRVASIPAGHPYVRHVLDGTGVGLLPDPPPPGASDGRWWPPVMCDAAWVTTNVDRFDVMHVHFGTESYSTWHLRSLVRALRVGGRPLVYTLHDLENPQLFDQAPHLEHLDVLVRAADQLVTLTAGAAAAIDRRWGRRAEVIPHPHVLPLDAPAPAGTRSDPYVLGVHLRDIRPGIDAVRTVAALLDAVDRLLAQGVAVAGRVHVNERVRDEATRAQVAALVAAHPAVELRRAERLGDEALARSIADLDVAVLPYRSGTHSGWAELCWDLGVPVAGPPVGYVREQHPEDFAVFGSGDELARAVRRLLAGATRPGSAARTALLAERRRQRIAGATAITTAHTALYERVLSRTAQVA